MTTVQSERWIGVVRETDALAASGTAPEVLERLVAACRKVAPRVALFLFRQGELRGWGSGGFDRSLAEGLRAFRAPLEQHPWFARLADQDALELHTRESGAPNFGQPPAAEVAGICLRVKGRPLAFLLAERAEGEEPWIPEALGLMVTVARLRLELDVALRQPREAGSVAGPAAQAVQSDAAVVRQTESATAVSAMPPPHPAHSTESRPTVEPTALAEADNSGAGASPEIAAARRFARLVATDIRLYNEESVLMGRRNRDLVERLGDQIDRGKDAFLRRHAGLGSTGLELLRDAYVQVLAGGDPSLFPSGCLE